MALGLNKILLSNAVANTAGAYFQTVTITSSTTGNGANIPAGMYIMYPATNVTVNAFNGSTSEIVMAANVGGVVFSDGSNVFLKSSAGNAVVTLLTVDGGLAANGTFNT